MLLQWIVKTTPTEEPRTQIYAMIINNKNILLFPEYHLTDFPPQVKMAQDEAYKVLSMYAKYGFDILIAGYIEVAEDNLYSSCLIIDDSNVLNIRKRHPYKDENKIIKAWSGENSPIDLAIGKSLFLLCHDLTMELKESKALYQNQNIENLFLISAMFFNFNENVKNAIAYCKNNNIKRFISTDRFNGIKRQDISKLV